MMIGMAILNGELFIVRERNSWLEIYDLSNIRHPRFVEVKELAAAFDICSCKQNNCLYIIHQRTCGTLEELLRINQDGEVVKKWLTEDNAKGNLSATNESVVVTDQDKHMLLEYSCDGELLRRITLAECINPWHAIKVANDSYIVSHGSLIDRVRRVCLVDENGNVKKAIGNESGCTDTQLSMPYYLAVGCSGQVMVVDLFSDRVLLLDSNLAYQTKFQLRRNDAGLDSFIFPAGFGQDEHRLVLPIITRAQQNNTDVEGESMERDATNENQCLLRRSKKDWKLEENCRLLVLTRISF